MQLLDGRVASKAVKEQLKAEVEKIVATGARAPHLAVILVGNNGASETYVASKVKTCAEIGYQSTMVRRDLDITEADLLAEIQKLNKDQSVDGILVQLPLPKHISEQKVIAAIDPTKDVDGFHPVSAGNLTLGMPTFIPATPYGIMLMLEHYQIPTKGKHAVVIGRSNIVGRPMSILLSGNNPYGNCTVTLCHSHTPNLQDICLQADIIVAALGRPGFVQPEMVKDGAIIIDVGITRVEDATAKKGYRIKGDVDFEAVAPKSSYITPVPGGVGLMTIAGLLKNTLVAYENRQEDLRR
ncbi:bifunctional 5,10-methylenetetrahydrofolate dehydrogenase/5,10-methenyltetrahydrofolate cyclohydrolase [Arachidicoccus terrestris]|uniref:bifunctional 5,10-methylenetetrahydrofolate dehydrogenase/5,10-methenyltetrahydrofolate cyclohydrolase n=1 Tax=Arachidicoccus terrestris TaxID=2875539 RepID=UPI001CC35745|nr:tetrahydrofolate dehydrogenase/cyclohydrolase catalytic domain-containing protein [Arachidicoccus terrestris]UAY56413.1 bifunctional 5,10-methylene-tetrahydrofolate dehydrogenase/5,10-methylene-tetrahydrofolate cyclohydrolase [Arachidicoccus terrestris]